jgi:predicted nucleic acid-binding Zn ribbon protein
MPWNNKSGKNDEFQSIGNAIRNLLNSYNLSSKFDEANLLNSWERLVGKPIAKRTKKLYIKNSVLFVEFDSPTMRHDFSLHKTQVLELFKKEFGSDIITEIVAM